MNKRVNTAREIIAGLTMWKYQSPKNLALA